MKYRALLAMAVLAVTGTLLVGCEQTPTPPVDKITHLEELLYSGLTLAQVNTLMTTRLQSMSQVFPAETIERTTTGGWSVKAKEGGYPGDTDAPYIVMIVTPDRVDEAYLAIFFENGVVFSFEQQSYTSVQIIYKVLGGEIESQLNP